MRPDYYERDFVKNDYRQDYNDHIARIGNQQANPPPGFNSRLLNPIKREFENWDNLFLNEDQGRKRREEVNNRVSLFCYFHSLLIFSECSRKS